MSELKSELILKSFIGLEIEYIFTLPSKRIDPILEEICTNSTIELIVCTSELAVLDSAIGYSALSKKVAAVMIDPEFIPVEFSSTLVKAKAAGLAILFVFAEILPPFVVSELESIGQSIEKLDAKLIGAEHADPKPRVLILESVGGSRRSTDHERLQFNHYQTTSTAGPERDTNHSSSSLVTSLIREVLNQSPNSILIPDAGGARKISLAHFSDEIAGPLNAASVYSMGRSLRSVRGVAVASPNRLPVMILGDGSMLIQGTELAWLARARISCLILLCLNGQLGDRKPDTYVGDASQLPVVDWEKFVVAMGARCAPIQSRFDEQVIEDFIRFAWEDRGPVVIPIDITNETASIYQLRTGNPFLDCP